jgi:uncharacterized iron-regulated protein
MKRAFELILLTILLCQMAASLYAKGDYMIYKNNGKLITVKQMAAELAKTDIVFFGEYHGDAVCHALELELLTEMHKVNPKIIVSMEMFERDAQDILIDYLADRTTEEIFLRESRPWPNYEKDYKPIISFSRRYELPVIAGNVPRRYASLVAKNGPDALKELPESEKHFFAKKLVVLDDDYKKEFMKTMLSMTAHGMPGDTKMFENMYAAQCLKDDSMAESMVKALQDFTGHRIIHFNGDFHSRKHLGTVQKVKLLLPEASIAVISPVYVDSQSSLEWDDSLGNEGDYLILIHKSADAEHTDGSE